MPRPDKRGSAIRDDPSEQRDRREALLSCLPPDSSCEYPTMRQHPEDLVDTVADRESLAAFLEVLSKDAVDHGSEWENLQIFDMLESMAAWLRDSSEPAPSEDTQENPWRLVARVVLAGKFY